MRQIIAATLVFSLAFPAWPQDFPPPGPPPPPDDGMEPPPPPPAPPADRVGYYESCFGVPRVGTGPFGISGEVVVPISGGSGSGSSTLPISSKGSDEKAWLIVAVLAAVALPAVVYAYDKPASRLVLQRFQCPTFTFDFLGGVDNGRTALNADGSYGFVSTRFGFGVGHVAGDFQYDGAPRSVSAFSTHLLLRPTPREHIELGLAIGYRRSILDDRVQDGLEVGLPHRYALWRDGLKTFALELRPMLLIGSSVEPSLEAAFLIPLAQILQLRAGGRVYTFAGDLHWGLSTGLGLTL